MKKVWLFTVTAMFFLICANSGYTQDSWQATAPLPKDPQVSTQPQPTTNQAESWQPTPPLPKACAQEQQTPEFDPTTRDKGWQPTPPLPVN